MQLPTKITLGPLYLFLASSDPSPHGKPIGNLELCCGVQIETFPDWQATNPKVGKITCQIQYIYIYIYIFFLFFPSIFLSFFLLCISLQRPLPNGSHLPQPEHLMRPDWQIRS